MNGQAGRWVWGGGYMISPSSPLAGVESELAGGEDNRDTVPENTSTNRRGESKYLTSNVIENTTELNPAWQKIN